MKILFYTNCQNWSLRYFLALHRKDLEFDEIPNYQFVDYSQDIDKDKLNSADVFIYQYISSNYGIRSTDPTVENNLLTNLRSDCIKISIPYLYNPVLWILIPPAIGDGAVGGWGDTSGYVNGESIIKMKKLGHSLNDIIKMYKEGSINFRIEERVEDYYKELDKRDNQCDVKTSDFIKQNIRKDKLFFTQNHPTSRIPGHIANQIFKILGWNFEINPFEYPLGVTHISSGSYPHSLYDKKYWNFEYDAPYSADSYISHIRNIYNLY